MIPLFAVLSTLCALAVQLGFAGFLLDLTPKGIDTGAAAGPGGIWLDAVLLLLFGLVHSLLARPAVKRRLPARAGRSLYNLIAAAQLVLLALCWAPLPATVWHVSGPAAAACLLLFAAGNALVLWALASIDPLHFFGLRQAFAPSSPEPAFSLRGPYRLVRHPVQTGLIVVLWATPHMSAGHLLMAGVLTLYSIAATLALEERDLRAAVGADYDAYRSRVPALLPWPRRRG
jgi:protein-S-isoprenylcysteine O-methyltransferase Ste14